MNIKKYLRSAIYKLPYISGLREKVNEQGAFSAGHYYSPIPSRIDVAKGLNSKSISPKLIDVDLRPSYQFKLLEEFSQYYEELPFTDKKNQDCRYCFDQGWFCYTDAIFLYSFIRYFDPKRIIEVGSGYSSAVMLDTLDKFPNNNLVVTLIEPFPERLNSLINIDNLAKVTLLENQVQEVDLKLFESLESGDLLFIDSSHVMKYGSDLHRIMFDILPILPVGVHVHFHDVFYPFEYPDEWLKEGRYWNESYLLRAFLAGNQCWEISLFNHYANLEFGDFIEKNMPLCRKNFGGSIYLKKIG